MNIYKTATYFFFLLYEANFFAESVFEEFIVHISINNIVRHPNHSSNAMDFQIVDLNNFGNKNIVQNFTSLVIFRTSFSYWAILPFNAETSRSTSSISFWSRISSSFKSVLVFRASFNWESASFSAAYKVLLKINRFYKPLSLAHRCSFSCWALSIVSAR